MVSSARNRTTEVSASLLHFLTVKVAISDIYRAIAKALKVAVFAVVCIIIIIIIIIIIMNITAMPRSDSLQGPSQPWRIAT